MTAWLLAGAVASCAGPGSDHEPPVAAAGTTATTSRAAQALPGLSRTDPTIADRDAWRAVLRWPADCEEAYRATHAGDDAGLAFHPVGDGITLVEVRCAAGAYQGSSVLVRLDESVAPAVARSLEFTTYSSYDEAALQPAESAELWGEVTVHAEARELTLLSVSRQTRDCGTWARYSLDGETPVLLALYAQVACPAEPGPPAYPEPGRPPAGWTKIPTE